MDRILEQVQNGDFDPVKEFTGNKEKFLEVKTAMESISNNLPKDVCIKFILTKIIPTVFNKTVDHNVRDGAVEIGLHFLQFVNISMLSKTQQEEVFHSIEETYTKLIGEFRDSNYTNWDKLWIFLIKLCSEKLHFKMSLANKLLRIVEVAFRNSTSIDHRLKAYDCWVELINNSSLNMDHMCSDKQIKLLVTPMKAKFSRLPIVILKRCDTFVYLLEKLQNKATLCLKEFLEFCFGPFDDKHVEKMRQGRSVSEVCNKSTRVLLAIIGHSHDDLETCLQSDDLHLYKPLIHNINFPNFAEHLINSVVECCVLLNEWSQDSLKNNTIIKCLWRSLLQFVHKSDEETKKKCCTQINNSLRKLLERARYNDNLHIVLGNIINLLIQDKSIEKLKEITFDICINLFNHDLDASVLNFEQIQNFIISCFDPENGSKFDKIASNSFKNNPKCQNPILCEIWLKCKIAIVPDNISNFIWPVRHFKTFNDAEALKSKWTKLYTSECKIDNVKFVILQEIEKLFLENPLLSSNIVEFLELISSGENNPGKDFVAKFMRLIELVLTLPNLSNTDVKKISSIVLSYCNQTQHFYKSENNDEVLEKLCSCLEHLVTIHKDYTILTELCVHLKNSQPKNLAKFSKQLMSFLEALMLNEDNSVANNTRKLIELLETKENEPDSFALTSSRSLRLINMANVTSKSKKLTNNSRLASPLSMKTSTVASPRTKNRVVDHKKRREPIILLCEENSDDFVKIDTEVKISFEKLNEHQKEMFKKRREDIPALYQDLTQSQSQDFFKSLGGNKSKKEEVKNDVSAVKNQDKSSENEKKDESAKTSDQSVFAGQKEELKKKKREDISPPLYQDLTQSQSQDFFKSRSGNKTKKAQVKNDVSVVENQDKSSENEKKGESEKTSDESVFTEQKEQLKKKKREVTPALYQDLTQSQSQDFFKSLSRNNTKKEEVKNDVSVVENQNKSSKNEKKDESAKTSDESIFIEQKAELQKDEEADTQTQIVDDPDITQSPDDMKIEPVEKMPPEELFREETHRNVSPTESPSRISKNTETADTETIEIDCKETNDIDSKETTGAENTETIDADDTELNDETEHEHVDKSRQKTNENTLTRKRRKYTRSNEKKEEGSVRKSLRQVKKRNSDYVYLEEKRRNSETPRTPSQDRIESKGDDEDDTPLGIRIRKQQAEMQDEVETESITELLARVDKRIEAKNKRRKSEETRKNTSLQDGNQNQILPNEDIKEDIPETNIRSVIKKAKRRLSLPIEKNTTLEAANENNESKAVTENDTYNEQPKVKIPDVYEFQGEEESIPMSEVKKPPKKRKKVKLFSRSDYRTKRRKRSRKENTDESIPFHVTADSPLPLSKSSSLRAVPSPDSSETITILITRSPDLKKENPESPQISGSCSPVSPRKRGRPKLSPSSEDVIESSQVSPGDERRRGSRSLRTSRQITLDDMLKPLAGIPGFQSRRKTRSSSQNEHNVTETETIAFNTEKPQSKVLLNRRFSLTEIPAKKQNAGLRNQRSKSLDKLNFSVGSITLTLRKNEAVHVNDTSVDTLSMNSFKNEDAEADTLTLSEPKDDLPSSPITCDTPDRNTELLNNTSDISPITASLESVSEVSTNPKPAVNEVSNVRVARLLQMVNSNVQVSTEGRRWFGNKPSPSSSRVRKMRIKKEENLDILTFSREVPSPLTLPASGILKRKYANLDETATPSPKRKRVNFSDPAITQKKIFIKNEEEYDIDKQSDSTSDSQISDVNNKPKGLFGSFNRKKAILNFKNFCDSNFKDLDDSNVQLNALECLLEKLSVPEIVEILSEYANSIDSETIVEMKNSTTAQDVINDVFALFVDNAFGFDDILSKILKTIEKLPDDRLEDFINNVTKVFEAKKTGDGINISAEQFEQHLLSLDCDKMNDMIKKYFCNLENHQRNDFLIDLMSLASSELPANKEFVNCHVNILQNFVKKMND